MLAANAIKTHRGLISASGQHLVLGGHVAAELGSSLNKVERLRLLADYSADPERLIEKAGPPCGSPAKFQELKRLKVGAQTYHKTVTLRRPYASIIKAGIRQGVTLLLAVTVVSGECK